MSKKSPYDVGCEEHRNSFAVTAERLGGNTVHRHAVANCTSCSATERVGMVSAIPPAIVLKKFRQKGWDFDHRGFPICPACQTAARAKRPALRVVASAAETAPTAPSAPPPPPAPQAPTPLAQAAPAAAPKPTQTKKETPTMDPAPQTLAPAAMRIVFGLLEEHFDTATGQYASGWSDRKVSETAKVAMVHVSRIRDDAFGPVRADPELQAIQAEQTRIGKAIEKLLDEHYAVAKRLETYAIKMGVK